MLNLSLPRCQAQLLKAFAASRPWRSRFHCRIESKAPCTMRTLCQSVSSGSDYVSREAVSGSSNAMEANHSSGLNANSLLNDDAAGYVESTACGTGGYADSVCAKLQGLNLSRAAYDQVTPFCVVNFYHLTVLEDPLKVVSEHRHYLDQKDIRGRIWISAQGINAQYGGTRVEAVEYAEWVAQQEAFKGLRWSVWPADDHMFPKLRLKHKPNLISLAGGMADLPVHDPASRATPLPPEDWKKMLSEAKTLRRSENAAERIVVLDVRNDYEWDAGHFEGAPRPDEEEFAETPTVLGEEDVPMPLKGLSKDTKVMMYCTGGIRCDVYSTLLKKKGFQNLYTLEGGVQNYLRQKGADLWNGSLFVFDGRMALPAVNKSPDAPPSPTALPAAVPCQLCGGENAQLPHMNCANIDCNDLFISCPQCKSRWNGCCCEACMRAPRLVRPMHGNGGRFGAWGNYVDADEWHPVMATGRSSEGRVARRARRRRAAQSKRQQMIEERNARKALVRAVMAEIAKKNEKQGEEAGHKLPVMPSS